MKFREVNMSPEAEYCSLRPKNNQNNPDNTEVISPAEVKNYNLRPTSGVCPGDYKVTNEAPAPKGLTGLKELAQETIIIFSIFLDEYITVLKQARLIVL